MTFVYLLWQYYVYKYIFPFTDVILFINFLTGWVTPSDNLKSYINFYCFMLTVLGPCLWIFKLSFYLFFLSSRCTPLPSFVFPGCEAQEPLLRSRVDLSSSAYQYNPVHLSWGGGLYTICQVHAVLTSCVRHGQRAPQLRFKMNSRIYLCKLSESKYRSSSILCNNTGLQWFHCFKYFTSALSISARWIRNSYTDLSITYSFLTKFWE
jgi:hypothetical protein